MDFKSLKYHLHFCVRLLNLHCQLGIIEICLLSNENENIMLRFLYCLVRYIEESGNPTPDGMGGGREGTTDFSVIRTVGTGGVFALSVA